MDLGSEQLLKLPLHLRINANGGIDVQRVNLVDWSGFYSQPVGSEWDISVTGLSGLRGSKIGEDHLVLSYEDRDGFNFIEGVYEDGWISIDAMTKSNGKYVHPGLYMGGFIYRFLERLHYKGLPVNGFREEINSESGIDTYYPFRTLVSKGHRMVRAIGLLKPFDIFRKMLMMPSAIYKEPDAYVIEFQETNLLCCQACPSKGAECPLRSVKRKRELADVLSYLAPVQLQSNRTIPALPNKFGDLGEQKILVWQGKKGVNAICYEERDGRRYQNGAFGDNT